MITDKNIISLLSQMWKMFQNNTAIADWIDAKTTNYKIEEIIIND